jgi:BolA family transcriptional regulator, general stress-responsive regulator
MAAGGGGGVYYARMVRKLTDALRPTRLVVRDESAAHAGHAGNPGGGETHFHVEVVSEMFAGVRMIERQRKVYAVLAEELAERVHALSMRTATPDEDARRAAAAEGGSGSG